MTRYGDATIHPGRVIRGRRRHRGDEGESGRREEEFIEIDAAGLTAAFATPRWLRDLGFTAWMLVGVALLLVGIVWILSLTHTIVTPVIAAAVVAAVASPLVRWLHDRGLPRAAGAALLMLGVVVLGALVVIVVVGGITSQSGDLGGHLSDAKNTLEGWLKDLGVDPSKAKDATKDASSSSTSAVKALLDGLGHRHQDALLARLLSLSDGPEPVLPAQGRPDDPGMGGATHGRAATGGAYRQQPQPPVPAGLLPGRDARGGLQRRRGRRRRADAGHPAGRDDRCVTFLAAYVPYLGAWTAGAFAVLIALGGAGTDAAVGMIVIQLLANGVLQQLVQPFAMGAALGIHPLAVLIVTIGGGALFGAVGLILAAPVTSAVVRISADLARARGEPDAERGDGPAGEPTPEAAGA